MKINLVEFKDKNIGDTAKVQNKDEKLISVTNQSDGSQIVVTQGGIV